MMRRFLNKTFLSIIVIFLLPISVFGWDWTVKYDMKQSDVRFDTIILSVPKVIKNFLPLISAYLSQYTNHTKCRL